MNREAGNSSPDRGDVLAELLPALRCPRSHRALRREGDRLLAEGAEHAYPLEAGVPDLMVAPERLQVNLPWIDPFEALPQLQMGAPEPLNAPDLPYHLHPALASVPGNEGRGRWILEVGCGERKCEPYFRDRGFRYVGTDADNRGIGPHLKVDAHNLPFVDGWFDFYFSLAVYEHLASPLQAAMEAFRVLKPGGTMFGTAAFVYGFHDRASFNHMTHAGLMWTLQMAGFTDIRIWPDWKYTDAIPEMAFGTGAEGGPWRVAARTLLKVLDGSFVAFSRAARRLGGKRPLDTTLRDVYGASSLTYVARKPG